LPLRFQTATAEDADGIVALLNRSFRTPIDAPTLNWFANANPNGPSRLYLAVDEDSGGIEGVFGFAPIRLRMSGTQVNAAYAHHLALAPACRDGLSFIAFSRHALGQEAARGTELVVGPPNRQAYPVHTKLMKWVDFGHLECLRKLGPQSGRHDCREITSFPASFDRFYEKVSAELVFCVSKKAEWMNWRFLSRPGSPYTVFATGPADDMTGYIVLKRWEDADGYRKAHILDLHAANEQALAGLIAAGESYASDCNELNLWACRGYVYRQPLAAMGFEPRDSVGQPFIAKTFNGAAPVFPAGPGSLSYGDGDSQY
jgi:hypothetical protein